MMTSRWNVVFSILMAITILKPHCGVASDDFVWVNGDGPCDSVCESVGMTCDMAGNDALDRDSCADLALSDDWINSDGERPEWTSQIENGPKGAWDDTDASGRPACFIGSHGDLWYNENKDHHEAGQWSRCDGTNGIRNYFCSCIDTGDGDSDDTDSDDTDSDDTDSDDTDSDDTDSDDTDSDDEPAHYVARGNPIHTQFEGDVAFYCQADSDNQAAYKSLNNDRFGQPLAFNIGVGCCSEDGSTGYRPSQCNVHPATYTEAETICAVAGYRLCTLQEMLVGKTKGEGCNYDNVYQWVKDQCSLDDSAQVSAPRIGSVVGDDYDAANQESSFDDYIPMAVGAAIGVIVVGSVVAFVVISMKKRKTAQKEETEMANVVHVSEVSPSADGAKTI